jgi:thiol-disulfide isomerase/thioredoxin
MSFRLLVTILSSVTVLMLSSFALIHAGSRNVVIRIDRTSLDKLLNQKDSRYVVAIMASWCAPCIDELPTLNRLHARYQSRGLHLIGLSIDFAGPEAIQPVVDRLGVVFPVYWYGDKAVEDFGLSAIPMLFFVRNGQIVEKLPGRRPEAFLEKKFRQFLQ